MEQIRRVVAIGEGGKLAIMTTGHVIEGLLIDGPVLGI